MTSINAVVSAIQEAWAEIETFDYWKSPKFQPHHYSDEDELTTKVAEILNDRLDNATTGMFRKEVFQTVVRDAKQSTATLGSTEQMPDLAFRQVSSAPGEDRDDAALFVEAKLLDASGGCREYVVNGLHRFVAGHYAPQMSFGMMLGYCVPGFNDPRLHLQSYFSLASSAEAKRCAATVSLDSTGLHTTDHTREAPAASRFRALHVWVERPSNAPILSTRSAD